MMADILNLQEGEPGLLSRLRTVAQDNLSLEEMLESLDKGEEEEDERLHKRLNGLLESPGGVPTLKVSRG